MRGQRFPWHGRWVISTFHPAAILHGGGERSRQFQELQEDFHTVRKTLDGCADPQAPDTVVLPTQDEEQLELF